MGTLSYDDAPPVEIADVALFHIRAVALDKLRRGESFSIIWRHRPPELSWTRIRVHPWAPLLFHFDQGAEPELDRVWLARLSDAADAETGIVLLRERTDPDVFTA